MGKTKKGGGKKKYGIVLALLLAFASSAAAQTPTNPRRVAWTCPDHATDDGHQIELRVRATGASVQVLELGDALTVTGGEVFADINVQPIAFGQYDLVVRAKAGTLVSANSNAVNFDRVPGPPTGARIVAWLFWHGPRALTNLVVPGKVFYPPTLRARVVK